MGAETRGCKHDQAGHDGEVVAPDGDLNGLGVWVGVGTWGSVDLWLIRRDRHADSASDRVDREYDVPLVNYCGDRQINQLSE